MVEMKCNWCHLLVCSSPSCKLQLLHLDQLKLLNKFLQNVRRHCRCHSSDKITFLLFWRLLLKVPINSKWVTHDSLLSLMKSTPTHIKESNWVTMWFWKIEIPKHVNLLLPLKDLEYFLLFPKQQLVQPCELYLTKLEAKLDLDHLTKFVLHKMNYNFC